MRWLTFLYRLKTFPLNYLIVYNIFTSIKETNSLINIYNKLNDFIWASDSEGQAFGIALIRKIIQILFVVIRDLADGQLTLRAMSLVYTTLLSLVPLLAVSFSVLKGFGVHNKVEPTLLKFLEPLGQQGIEITQKIIEFVNNVKVGVLGSLGLFLLLYTVVSLIQKIERAFNFTWNVSQTRPITQRFSDYLSVIFVGPILIFTAIGITASISSASVVQYMQSIEALSVLLVFVGKALPYILIICAFTFIYMLIPNTKVKFKSALIGAIISGILWETTGWVFASFLIGSGSYTAIYSAFATLILFLIWLYLSWVILLTGASIAFYHQNPEYITCKKVSLKISNRAKEYLTIQVLLEISVRYQNLSKEITFEELIQQTSIPSVILSQILDNLELNGYVVQTADDPSLYFPAIPLDQMKINDVLSHIRNDGRNYHLENKFSRGNGVIETLFQSLDDAVGSSLNDMTMSQLIETNQTQK